MNTKPSREDPNHVHFNQRFGVSKRKWGPVMKITLSFVAVYGKSGIF